KRRIEQFRDMIDVGRVQVGFGDQRFIDDEAVRQRFKLLFAREVELASAGQAGGDAQAYARSIANVLGRANAVENRLDQYRLRLETDARNRAEQVRGVVFAESANVERYAQSLDGLDSEARVLVGEVAMRNFMLVRDRLKNIVLRADTGIVQQAWE